MPSEYQNINIMRNFGVLDNKTMLSFSPQARASHRVSLQQVLSFIPKACKESTAQWPLDVSNNLRLGRQ